MLQDVLRKRRLRRFNECIEAIGNDQIPQAFSIASRRNALVNERNFARLHVCREEFQDNLFNVRNHKT